MKPYTSLFSSIIIFLICTSAYSQFGNFDPSFNTFDIGNGVGQNGFASRRIPLQFGKSLVIDYHGNGYTSNLGTGLTTLNRIFNSDGRVDTSFNQISISTTTNTYFQDAAVLPSGKIIVVGTFDLPNGSGQKAIARYNSNGTLDTTFNAGGVGFQFSTWSNYTISKVVVQPDEKLICIGDFQGYNGVYFGGNFNYIRLLPDGQIDASFNNLQLASQGTIYDVHLLNNGKILMAGSFISTGADSSGIFQLLPNGMVDPNFSGMNLLPSVQDIDVNDSGNIIVAGNFNNPLNPAQNYLSLLDSNGVTNPNFISPYSSYSPIHRVGFNSLNRIVSYTLSPGDLKFFDSLNQIDYLNSPTEYINIENLSFDDSGNTYVFGIFTFLSGVGRNNSMKFNSNWQVDTMFNVVYGSNAPIKKIAHNPATNELYAVCGSSFNNYSVKGFVRLDYNGNVDNSFNPETELIIRDFVELNDSSVIVGGDVTSAYNSSRLMKISRNGTRDMSFNGGLAGPNNLVTTMSLQLDGKILVGGTFNSYGSVTNRRLIRIYPNGLIDNSFTAPASFFNISPFTNKPLSIVALPSGQILVSGQLKTAAGTYAVIRLNSDGTLDPAFTTLLINNNATVEKITVLANNKILINGSFTEINGQSIQKLARLNENGTLDLTFNFYQNTIAPYGFEVDDIEPISLNEYAISGFFNYDTYINNYQDFFLLINSSGNLISTNYYGQLDSISEINDMKLLPDGRLLLGGGFTSYNGFGKNSLVRVRRCASSPELDSVITCSPYTWIDGNTYTSDTSQVYFIIPGSTQCDSLLELNLSFVPSTPITYNTFNLPSDSANCNGAFGVSLFGYGGFTLNLDNSIQSFTTSQNSVFDSICGGIHSLSITDNCGDTVSIPIVIPIESNYVYINPFIDSLALDSLGSTITNCLIYYNSIDTAFIDSIWSTGNVVTVVWNIVDSTGSNYDTSTYVLNYGSGVYLLQLSIFCPTKSIEKYFAVTQAIYFNNGFISIVGDQELAKKTTMVYPNPTLDRIHVVSSEFILSYEIIESSGRLVQKGTGIFEGLDLNFGESQSGLYILKIKTKSGTSIHKLIKK